MPQINKPTDYFNTKLYTGDGTTSNSITGVGFKPDLVWIKIRDAVNNHVLYDVVRGANNTLRSSTTGSETNNTDAMSSFNADGFTVGENGFTATNDSGFNYASWNWLAGGTASSNTDGSITSSVSANTTSGFSIVSYTGSASSTVGHGLNSTVDMIILKQKNVDGDWCVYHSSLGKDKVLIPNSTSAAVTVSNFWGTSTPDSNVFGTASSGGYANASGDIIAYCFAEKKGFSKFGSYIGNGSTDGTFVYTGFKPAFVMTKSSSTGGTYYYWGMMDNKRGTYNVINAQVCANLSDAENSANIGNQYIDFLSNGFKPRVNGSSHNASGVTYIYMAFAENPLVGTNNIPATAR